DTDQGGDLLAVELAKLGQLGEQRPSVDRTDAFYRTEEVFLLAPERAFANGLIDIVGSPLDGLLEPRDVFVEALASLTRKNEPAAVLLHRQHLDQLAS